MSCTLRGPVTVLVAACALAAPAAAHADARDIARDYLNANPERFGVTSADVADAFVMSSYTTSGTGVTHVNVNQRHEGLEVFGGHATINVGPDGRVIFTGGRLVKLNPVTSETPKLDPVEAVDVTARKLRLDRPSDLRVLRRGIGKVDKTVLSTGGISGEPIESRLGWWPENGQLRLAYQSVIDDSENSHLWAATVDARTGALLNADDWTSHDNAKDLGQRLDRQTRAAQRAPAFQPFALMSSPEPVLDGSAYRVFAWPNESPNDAGRTLVANPADSVASPRGWHDINNSPGADFITTQGNNVNAYLDQDANNAPDYRSAPSGGSSLRFDFPLDLAQHAQANRDAAVTNLFYSNNMIHDVLYRYGFDDASGNFQENNYGRGGTGGDPVQAEAADGSGTNNANFSTPAADGGKPRMQMYLWPGSYTTLGPQNQLVIDGGATYGASWARFTPPVMSTGLPGRTLVYGGTGCTESTYPASRPGENWIAVLDGSTTPCTYLRRVEVAQSLNADAVVVIEGAGTTPATLTGSMVDAPVVIPAVAVNAADGAAIKALIGAGPAPTANLRMNPDRPPIRDGDIDNGIVIHEYGHGVSNRLTGGPKTSNCLSGNEQAGEGWSDFFAITFMLDPRLDKPEGTRGLVPYALFQPDRTAAGLRPRPYSRNMEIQPFTYDSIKTNGWLNGTSLALPHGLGHGWAAVLWDMTWDLIDKHGFNPSLYGTWNSGGNNRAIQYVVDGLKMQGCFPGLVVSRDAIIAGAEARNPGADTCTIWASFARRGFGYSAVQGTTNRNDNTEAFDTHPDCRRNFQAPVLPEPALNERPAGSTVDLRFTADGYRGLDVLAENQLYSRQVDCTTLQTVNPGQTDITPRPYPVKANGTLSVNDRGIFTFPWQSEAGWAGTCRELVATADTGKQYRAYFRFT